MKKLLLLGTFLTATMSGAFAQTEKGSLMLGSNISQIALSKTRGGGTTYFSGALAPNAGLFVTDRLALGAQLVLGYQSQKTEYAGFNSKIRDFEYGIAPFARYYFADAPKHKFFGQVSYGITGYSTKYVSSELYDFNRASKGSYSNGRASLGYNYFITPMVALEAQPYFELTNRGQLAADPDHGWGLSVGFQIFLPKGSSAAGE